MTQQTDRLNSALTGRYTIERELGAGGMATVFLANDLKHDRHVALKVLKPELAAVLGAERFVVEIKTTAALQHPHILPLFDSGTADSFLFYVMPFIEGETLRDKLNRETQLGVDDAVRIAREVLDALQYAHEHGIVHRDVKPENILLHGGHAMVADFGIALAVSAAAGGRMTETGLSLGTPHYMSPEQATAEKEITARSDVYSLGSVLYEMITGSPPHTGATAQQIIMKIITEPAAPVTQFRKSVPQNVAGAVAKSLEKLPADRFESAQAFADALGNPAYTNAAAATSTGGARLFAGSRSKRELILVAALAVAIAGWGLTAFVQHRSHGASDSPVLRLQLIPPKDVYINDGFVGSNIAISPQGDLIAFVGSSGGAGGSNIWLRRVDQLDAKQVTLVASTARNPTFSPDGKWIAFSDNAEIKKVSVDGGPSVTLTSIPDIPSGLSWGSGGFIVSGSSANGLYVLPERGGAARAVPKVNGEGSSRWPLVLPNGKQVIFLSIREGGRVNSRLVLLSLADGKRTDLEIAGTSPLGVLNGQLIYVIMSGAIMAVPFDGRTASGTAVPLVQDVVVDGNAAAKAALSATGTLVYRSGKAENSPVVVKGNPMSLLADVRNYSTPRYSPDGKRVAFTVSDADATDVWVYDRAQSTLTKITSDGLNQRPEWTADGKRLLFVSDRGGKRAFWWQAADGSAPAQMLYMPAEGDPYEAVMTRDGHWLVYRTGPAGKPARSIFAVDLQGDRKASVPIVSGKSYIQMPRLSPDGKWIAYQDNESGRYEIYVRPIPGPGGRVQISASGGAEPIWAATGNAIYYRNGNDVIRVAITLGASIGIGERKVVLNGSYIANASHPNWDVSPDGSELLLLRRAGEDVQTIVVHNWARELAAKTAGKR